MRKPFTKTEWVQVPYDFAEAWRQLLADLKLWQRENSRVLMASSSLIGMSCSGCAGLEAYLEYNESKVAGCFVVPIYGAEVTPEESAPKQIECPKPIKVIPVSP